MTKYGTQESQVTFLDSGQQSQSSCSFYKLRQIDAWREVTLKDLEELEDQMWLAGNLHLQFFYNMVLKIC